MSRPPSDLALWRVEHGGLDVRELRALGLDPEQVVDLSANLHPEPTPRAVIEAMLTADVSRYPDPEAAPLREAIARAHDLDPASIVITPGSAAAIYLALAALLREVRTCTVFAPTFGEYAPAVQTAGGIVRRVETRAPEFDIDDVPETPVTVLCNPNNPTGRYLDRAAVEAVLARTGHLVIDAAYEPFAEARWDADDLVREGAPVTVIHSFTKIFAMPGVRLGYVVAPPDIAREITRRQPPWPAGAHAMAAGLAALEVADARIATMPSVHARRRRIEATFTASDARTTDARANFVLAEVGDAPAFRAALLRRGFAVRDATSFSLPRWVRLAVPSEAQLPRLLQAIPGALGEIVR